MTGKASVFFCVPLMSVPFYLLSCTALQISVYCMHAIRIFRSSRRRNVSARMCGLRAYFAQAGERGMSGLPEQHAFHFL